MGIGLCKYLNRFSMMPYFHSAINVFKWLSLSSGFVIHSRNDSLKIEEEEKKKKVDTSLFLCQFRGGQWIELRCEAKQHESTAARHSWTVRPAFSLLPSGWQQWAESPNRRLPLSDYNLWSISLIGGVCRDSYSNNYLDWSVSKATNILPPPLPYTQTVTLPHTLLWPACSQ